MVKKRTRNAKQEALVEEQIDAFGDDADPVPAKLEKPAQDKQDSEEEKTEPLARTTISLPASLMAKAEDLAIKNKRTQAEGPRTMSAVVRAALESYLK